MNSETLCDRHQLIAYLATLGALVIVFIAALAFAAACQQLIGRMEAFGLGTLLGGLIGLMRMPSSRASFAATRTGDVNVAPAITPAAPAQEPPAN